MKSNIGKSHYVQLLAYVETCEREGWYYGNKAQFRKRHEQIIAFLKEAIQKSSKPKSGLDAKLVN